MWIPGHRRKKPGFALVTVLLFSGIILMMVLALFLSVRGELFTSWTYRNQTAALYLAETGMMDAIAQLEADPTWTAGFKSKSVKGQEGTYSVAFNTGGGPFTPTESVSNTDGTHDANYRGTSYVPPGCVSLVVTANVGGYERQVESLIRVGGGLYPADAPLITTGRIDLRGSVNIDGRKSQSDPTRVDANVHSNKAEADKNIVVWDNIGDAHIDGKVSVVAPNDDAINVPDSALANGKQAGAASQNIANVNVLAKIEGHKKAPVPTFGSGVSVLKPSSATQKDFYKSGDVTIQGDLVLDGVNLYVDGNFKINGSITGSGSVFVAKNTTLQGDARIASASPDAIALFSQGNVELSGFDGTEYMDSLAAGNPALGADWKQLSDSIADYRQYLDTPGDAISAPASDKLDRLAQEISGTDSSVITPTTVPGRKRNVTRALIEALKTQPDSTAKTRMTQKFEDLNSLFFSYTDGTNIENDALQALKSGRIIRGGFDAAVDKFNTLGGLKGEIKKLMNGYVQTIDYKHLGAAYFQGLIFTHGSIYTDSEVTVQGAVVGYDDGSQKPTTINGETVNPGDLVLQPLTRISYIEEFFKPKDATGGVGAAGAQILLWMGR